MKIVAFLLIFIGNIDVDNKLFDESFAIFQLYFKIFFEIECGRILLS